VSLGIYEDGVAELEVEVELEPELEAEVEIEDCEEVSDVALLVVIELLVLELEVPDAELLLPVAGAGATVRCGAADCCGYSMGI